MLRLTVASPALALYKRNFLADQNSRFNFLNYISLPDAKTTGNFIAQYVSTTSAIWLKANPILRSRARSGSNTAMSSPALRQDGPAPGYRAKTAAFEGRYGLRLSRNTACSPRRFQNHHRALSRSGRPPALSATAFSLFAPPPPQ